MTEESSNVDDTAPASGLEPKRTAWFDVGITRRVQLVFLSLVLASTLLLVVPTLTLSQSLYSREARIVTQEAPQLVEFQRQPGVVIVTKIHNLDTLDHGLQQALCLFHHAYNQRVNYDIVVFTTEPILDFAAKRLQDIVAPANLRLVWDNPGLRQMVSALPQEQRHALLQRCGIKSIRSLNWDLQCQGDAGATLRYTWQAEFRAYHLWHHPALAEYRYMLWLDSDAFCTQPWKRDPIVMAMQNQLTLLFDHFPQGSSQGEDFDERYRQILDGKSLCHIRLGKGNLQAKVGRSCSNQRIGHVHGFFHVTDMDFYRSEQVQKWLRVLIGTNYSFSRKYDDQIAVTVPAAIWSPNRAWEMEAHGFRPEVYHNKDMDGRPDRRATPKGGFTGNFLTNNVTKTFPQAVANCTLNTFG